MVLALGDSLSLPLSLSLSPFSCSAATYAVLPPPHQQRVQESPLTATQPLARRALSRPNVPSLSAPKSFVV